MRFIFLISFLPSILFCQVKQMYFNGNDKIIVDTANQMLNGNFKYYYNNGKLKAKGQFKNNQKIGNWEFYAENGKQLIKREYSNNFIFNEDEISSLGINNFNYWDINDYNILYKDVFLTLISNSNVNKEFFDSNLLINEIKNYINKSTNPEIYKDDLFSYKLTKKEIDEKHNRTQKVESYVFKEMVYYDLKNQILVRRVLAIMPVEIKKNEIVPLFSIWCDDFRKFTQNKTILKKLFFNEYYGNIVKIYEVDNRESSNPLRPQFDNQNISWYNVKKPFDLEMFLLEKEVTNNLRLKIEPDLYISSKDSLNLSKERIETPKYHLK